MLLLHIYYYFVNHIRFCTVKRLHPAVQSYPNPNNLVCHLNDLKNLYVWWDWGSFTRLTFDCQVERGVHDAIAIVSSTGINSLIDRRHIIQGEGDVGRCVPQQFLISKHPGDPGRGVTVHLTVQRHRAALHHLWRDVHPHRTWSICKEKQNGGFKFPTLRCPHATKWLPI